MHEDTAAPGWQNFFVSERSEIKTAYCLGILDFLGKATRLFFQITSNVAFSREFPSARVPLDALELTVFLLYLACTQEHSETGKFSAVCGSGSSVELIPSSRTMRVASSCHNNAPGFVHSTSSRAANAYFQQREWKLGSP